MPLSRVTVLDLCCLVLFLNPQCRAVKERTDFSFQRPAREECKQNGLVLVLLSKRKKTIMFELYKYKKSGEE